VPGKGWQRFMYALGNDRSGSVNSRNRLALSILCRSDLVSSCMQRSRWQTVRLSVMVIPGLSGHMCWDISFDCTETGGDGVVMTELAPSTRSTNRIPAARAFAPQTTFGACYCASYMFTGSPRACLRYQAIAFICCIAGSQDGRYRTSHSTP